MRYAAKTDENHTRIANAFRSCGASVHSVHRVGEGFPDLAVGYMGFTWLVEVKTETGTLNPAEYKWHNEWKGHAVVVKTAGEAVRWIERWRDLAERARLVP